MTLRIPGAIHHVMPHVLVISSFQLSALSLLSEILISVISNKGDSLSFCVKVRHVTRLQDYVHHPFIANCYTNA
jgi:hypothetical protein